MEETHVILATITDRKQLLHGKKGGRTARTHPESSLA